jgi:hypothetical protein
VRRHSGTGVDQRVDAAGDEKGPVAVAGHRSGVVRVERDWRHTWTYWNSHEWFESSTLSRTPRDVQAHLTLDVFATG